MQIQPRYWNNGSASRTAIERVYFGNLGFIEHRAFYGGRNPNSMNCDLDITGETVTATGITIDAMRAALVEASGRHIGPRDLDVFAEACTAACGVRAYSKKARGVKQYSVELN